MARPHPVVCIPAELADGRRRSTHQTDVTEHPENEQVILIPVEEGLDIGPKALRGIRGLADEAVGIDLHDRVTLRFRHPGLISLENQVRHFVHTIQETDGQSLVRKLLATVHRPEAVPQVIVLHAAVPLDIAVAAVMVRQQKPFIGHQLTRAPAPEQDDGILERRLIHAVHILGRQPESLGLHISDPLPDQRRQPHPLIRPDRQDEKEHTQNE